MDRRRTLELAAPVMLVLLVVIWPAVAVVGLWQTRRFRRALRRATGSARLAGDDPVIGDRSAPLSSVVRARLHERATMSMASGAEYDGVLELWTADDRLAIGDREPAYRAALDALRTRGLVVEAVSGGTTGGLGDGLAAPPSFGLWVGVALVTGRACTGDAAPPVEAPRAVPSTTVQQRPVHCERTVETWTGDLGGLEGADAICREAFPGSHFYRAALDAGAFAEGTRPLGFGETARGACWSCEGWTSADSGPLLPVPQPGCPSAYRTGGALVPGDSWRICEGGDWPLVCCGVDTKRPGTQ